MDNYAPALTERQAGHLPDLLGLEWRQAHHGFVAGRLEVKANHMAPNGFLHAASVIALADFGLRVWRCCVQARGGDRLHHD